MARRKTGKGAGRRDAAASPRGLLEAGRSDGTHGMVPRMRAALEAALHPQPISAPPWKHLPLVLTLAFAVRAGVALSGDFVLHPDEIMQYLEPAHRLVFGAGVTYWEYFYGARSWLVPGMVAAILWLFDVLGFGQPSWYVSGVKLVFCAISLAIPVAMYFFARRHFSEAAARVALLAGAFWYELAGFAHKPMTEFVATAPLLLLLALCLRPFGDRTQVLWPAALLAVLASAIRLQYAPLAMVLFGIVLVRTEKKARLALIAAGLALAVGAFDGITWDASLFHSYVTNVHLNLILGEMRTGESPPWQFLVWLALASAGLSVVCMAGALLRYPARYGFLLTLIALVLVMHSLQAHKEYRFIFVVVPLWLLIGADLVTRAFAHANRGCWLKKSATGLFAVVSLAGILNALPHQDRVYRAWSGETGAVGFVRNQDPIFAAYRYLAAAPDVDAVWQVDRPHYNLPGYYYLHRTIPFYDTLTQRFIPCRGRDLAGSVSHLVSEDPDVVVPGYSVEREFGTVRILRRDERERNVRQWQGHVPVLVGDLTVRIMRRIAPQALLPPVNAGIRFVDVRCPPEEQ